MSKRKIIFFIDSLASGGAQRQLVTLAAGIDKKLFEPVFLIYHPIWHFKKILDANNVRVEYLPKKSKFDITFLYRLMRFLYKENPDIVLSYLNTANMWARLAGKLAGVQTIITSERNIDIVHSKTRVLIEKLLHRYSHTIVVNASATKKLLIEKIGIRSEKIKLIYNGVDIDQFEAVKNSEITQFRNNNNLNQNDFLLTLPGRVFYQKNHMCLLKAVNLVCKENPSLRLLFVGEEIDFNLLHDLKVYIQEHDLTKYVRFLGKRSDMNCVYAVSDVVVLPSLWEGFPNVVLEAFLMTTPVIASDIADNSKLVLDGENGYLFPKNDHESLAIKINEMISLSTEKRHMMGLKGKSHVEQKFSKTALINNYTQLINTLT